MQHRWQDEDLPATRYLAIIHIPTIQYGLSLCSTVVPRSGVEPRAAVKQTLSIPKCLEDAVPLLHSISKHGRKSSPARRPARNQWLQSPGQVTTPSALALSQKYTQTPLIFK